MTDLKPCPFFCGGDDVVLRGPRVDVEPTVGGCYYVLCNGCSACGPECHTEAEAIEAWNRRTEPGLVGHFEECTGDCGCHTPSCGHPDYCCAACPALTENGG